MDGENNGKPYSNGWFGGTLIFGNTHMMERLRPFFPAGERTKLWSISLRRSWCLAEAPTKDRGKAVKNMVKNKNHRKIAGTLGMVP